MPGWGQKCCRKVLFAAPVLILPPPPPHLVLLLLFVLLLPLPLQMLQRAGPARGLVGNVFFLVLREWGWKCAGGPAVLAARGLERILVVGKNFCLLGKKALRRPRMGFWVGGGQGGGPPVLAMSVLGPWTHILLLHWFEGDWCWFATGGRAKGGGGTGER